MLLATFFIAFRPQGVAAKWLEAVRVRREVAKTIRSHWVQIASPEEWRSPHSYDSTRLVLFFDYRCTYCASVSNWLETNGELESSPRIRLRFLPRPGDSIGERAARASICASRLGQFSKLHRYLLGSDDWSLLDSVPALTTAAGINDGDAFARCLLGEAPKRQLLDDATWAERLGIRGTPAFVTERHGVYIGSDTASIRRFFPKHE